MNTKKLVVLVFAALSITAEAAHRGRGATAKEPFAPDWSVISTVAFTGRTAEVRVCMPVGKRAQLGFELSGEVANPVVDGRFFRVTLGGPDEKLVCHDGRRWTKLKGDKTVEHGDVTNALAVAEEGVTTLKVETCAPSKATFTVCKYDLQMPNPAAGVSDAADAFIVAARRAYATEPYAAYTNTLVKQFVREVPKGFRADLPHKGSLVRWIDVEGSKNFRDIGGWTGLKTGLVYRGAELNCRTDTPKFHNLLATRNGLQTLADLGIKTDLDLRGRGECLRPDETPIPGATLVRCTSSAYTNMLKNTASLARTVRVFADRRNYPIYFHCYGGADRTGTLAMIIEGLCGVSEADISIDYELTTFGLSMRTRVDSPYWFATAIAWIKRMDGDTFADKVANYLTKKCGMDESEIAAIRSILMESSASRPQHGLGTIVSIDPAKAVIVSSGTATKTAAAELKCHLDLISGGDVKIAAEAAPGAYAFRFDTGELCGNTEACSWKSTSTETTFRGHPYFAVVDFLENALGVRWPDGASISYTAQSPLVALRQTCGSWVPELKIRGIRGARASAEYATFSRRMRRGRHSAPSYGHAFTKYWPRFGLSHRQYFAMRPDGMRGPVKSKPEDLMNNVAVALAADGNSVAMCCSSTGFVAQIIADWIDGGKKEYINLCENDEPGQNSCRCPSCRALDVVPEKVDPKWETHYADRYVYFANAVLAEARKHRPDVKACLYAYNATQDAPRREIPDPAICVGLVPTYFDDAYIHAYVGSWKKAGARHFFYRPNRHCYYSIPYLPYGAEKHFFGILRYLVSQGCIGFDYDGPGARDGSFEWFESYILHHAMQDPSKPFEHWESHFCSAYGAAAEDVKSYYRFWREEVWEKRLEPNRDEIVREGKCFNFGRGLLQNLGDYYRSGDFSAAERFVAAAESRDLAEPQLALVRKLRIAHDHAKVYFEAVAHKSKANTEALVAYCRAHGYPLYTWQEQYYGDITGVEGLLGPEKK